MIENSNQVVKPQTSHSNAHPKVDLMDSKQKDAQRFRKKKK